MAADDQAPLDDEPDPTEDTPAPEGEATTEADDQPGSDRDERLTEAHKTITRQAQELALYRGKSQEPDEAADEGAATSDDLLTRATQDSWSLAAALYGEQAIDAYRSAHRLLDAAATPADYMAAFEAYHEIRSGKPADATNGSSKPTRAEAVAPKVDSNRSDLGPDLANADEKLAEARKGKSLSDFASAAAARFGYGPSR